MRKLLPLLLVPLAIAADRPDRVPGATPVGRAQTCIPISQIRDSLVRSDQVIDFVLTGRQVYRVTLDRPCPQLGFEQRFAFETSLSQLCSTDLVTVLQSAPTMPGARCGLAPFQPVTLAPTAKGRR